MDEAYYAIRVKSYLGADTISAFDNFAARQTANGDTVLTGLVTDQAALHGILMKIRDLGLTLVEVRNLNGDCNE